MRDGLRLTDVTFSERRRGYDPDEVSNFLNRVNDAIVELQRRLEAAEARAMSAEERAEAASRHAAELEERARAAEATGGSSETEEALKRVLVLAQKTADEAIAEANRRGGELVRDAEKKAERIVGDAERRAKALIEDAERRARERAALQSRPIEVEMRRLEQRKTELLKEVAALEEQIRRHLDSAKAAATRLLEAVEAAGAQTRGVKTRGGSQSEPLQSSPAPAQPSHASAEPSADPAASSLASGTSDAESADVSEATSTPEPSEKPPEARSALPEDPPLLRELREVVADSSGGDPDARLEDFLEGDDEDRPRGLLTRRRRERNGESSE